MIKIETSNYKRLIGVWKTEGLIFTEKGNLKLGGIDSYEFILDGNYILHKADVKMGNERSETFEIISLDNSIENGKFQYYNSKGESGVMTGSLAKNKFKINGDKIKFEGILNDENSRLVGKWYLQADNEEWTDFIEISLTKQNWPG